MSQHEDDCDNNASPPLPGQGGEGEIRVVHAEDVVRELEGQGTGGSSSQCPIASTVVSSVGLAKKLLTLVRGSPNVND